MEIKCFTVQRATKRYKTGGHGHCEIERVREIAREQLAKCMNQSDCNPLSIAAHCLLHMTINVCK